MVNGISLSRSLNDSIELSHQHVRPPLRTLPGSIFRASFVSQEFSMGYCRIQQVRLVYF